MGQDYLVFNLRTGQCIPVTAASPECAVMHAWLEYSSGGDMPPFTYGSTSVAVGDFATKLGVRA